MRGTGYWDSGQQSAVSSQKNSNQQSAVSKSRESEFPPTGLSGPTPHKVVWISSIPFFLLNFYR